MAPRNYQLPDTLPATARLLQHVFGTHRVPVPTRTGYTMSAELLGLDWLRLVMAGGTRLPILCLIGPTGHGTTLFLAWLSRFAARGTQPAMPVVHVQGLGHLRDHAVRRELLVSSGPASEAMATMLSLIANSTCFIQHDSKGRIVATEPIECALLHCAQDTQGLHPFTCPLWVRQLAHPIAHTDQQVQHLQRALDQEMHTLADLLLNRPFLTRAEADHWFAPELITTPDPCAS